MCIEIPDQSDEENKTGFVERVKSISEVKTELAYHEASHFVFSCLGLKHVSEFTPISFIMTCLEDENSNIVNGFGPNIDMPKYSKKRNEKPEEYYNFYKNDRRRIVAKILSSLAGYASFKVFISEDDYFISMNTGVRINSYHRKLTYYCLRSALFEYEQISDLENVKEKLADFYSHMNDKNIIFTTIVELINIVQELMQKNQGVNDCIRFVKNELLKNPCSKIEEKQLNHMICEVNRLTNQLDYMQTLNDLREQI